MKIFNTILTYAFALIYLLFALNFFLGFLPMPPLEGDALTYMTVMGSTGYMVVVKVFELIVAIMLIANFKRPLAWLLVLPISTNILMYDVFIVGAPGLGIPVMAINLYMGYLNRKYYVGITAKI
jgi:putative oxidoreductase